MNTKSIGRNTRILFQSNNLHKDTSTSPFKPYSIYKLEVSSLFTKYQHKATKNKVKYPFTDKAHSRTRNRFMSPSMHLQQCSFIDNLLYTKEKNDISRILSQSRHNDPYSSYDKETKAEVKLKVKLNSPTADYQDPFESFRIIKNNKQIYTSIIKQNQQRALQSFSKIITDINAIKEKQKQKGQIKIRSVQLKRIKVNFNPKHPLPRNSSCKVVSFNNMNNTVYLKAFQVYPKKNFPESRQQFTLVSDSVLNGNSDNDGDEGNSHLYLFGGISSNKETNFFWRLNLNQFNWECIKAYNMMPMSRYGHTCVCYKNKLVLYGGKMLHEPIYAGLDVYNIDTHEWSSPILPHMNYIRLRYGHIACIIGHHMLIHGGITELGDLTNETMLLHLGGPQIKWTKCHIDTSYINTNTSNVIQSPHRALHSCCLILPNEILTNPRLNIYAKFDVNIEQLNKNIKEIGLYIFGGKEKGKDGVLTCSNDLFVLHLCTPRPNWAKISTKGLGPSPRYMMTMTYYGLGNMILIHGGRVDIDGTINELSDLYALDLFRLEWIRVMVSNMVLDKRCGHGSFISNDYYYIYGGMNSEKFLRSSFVVIDLLDEENKIEIKQSSSSNNMGGNSANKSKKESQRKMIVMDNSNNDNNCTTTQNHINIITSPKNKFNQLRFNLNDNNGSNNNNS